MTRKELLLEVPHRCGSWSEVARGQAVKFGKIIAGDTKGRFHGLGSLDASLRRLGEGQERLPMELDEDGGFVYVDDSECMELIYFGFLKMNLTFPFLARSLDPITDRKREVTVNSMCKYFSIDEDFGVVCDVLNGDENARMQLSELEMDPDNPSYQIVDDYITWFVSTPESGAGPFSNEW